MINQIFSHNRRNLVTLVLLSMLLLVGQSAAADAQTPCNPTSDPVTDILCVDQNGNLGIGTTVPAGKLHINIENAEGPMQAVIIEQANPELKLTSKPVPDADPGYVEGGNWSIGTGWSETGARKAFYIYDYAVEDTRLVIDQEGRVGLGTRDPDTTLELQAVVPEIKFAAKTLPDAESASQEGGAFGIGTGWGGAGNRKAFFIYDYVAKANRFLIDASGHVGIGEAHPDARLNVEGTTRTSVLQITGGSDLAEPFEITETDAVKPGMVVAIDADHPGQLRISNTAYDRSVAGVVSGAGGIQPGLIMQQEGTLMTGSHPVALTGRVYVLADPTNGTIEPGDLLTTSDVPGHAMKVADYGQATGAILGKAMSALDEETGLVLLLVTLQ